VSGIALTDAIWSGKFEENEQKFIQNIFFMFMIFE